MDRGTHARKMNAARRLGDRPSVQYSVRLSGEDAERLERAVADGGFASPAAYIRSVVLPALPDAEPEPLPTACPSCGAAYLTADQLFCTQCGAARPGAGSA